LQPDDFVLYLDENLCNCQPILDILKRLGVSHKRHLEFFKPGTRDRDWLRHVGEEQWVVLTADQQIRYNEQEKQEVVSHRVREFVFSSGNLAGQEMAAILEIALPRIKRLCEKQAPPFVATITKGGHVNLVFDRLGSVHHRKRKR
jgi:site-specific recombinase